MDKDKHNQETTDTQESGTPEEQGENPAQGKSQSDNNKKPAKERDIARTQYWTAIFAGVAAVFAAISSATSCLQLREMRDATERTHRAWMIPYEISPPGETPEEKRTINITNNQTSFMVTIINAGESPAFNVIVKTSYDIKGIDDPPPCGFKKLPGEPISRAVVPPDNRDKPLKTEVIINDFTPDIIKQLTETKEKRLFIAGLIEYDDEFRPGRETAFCQFYVHGDKVSNFQNCPCLNWVK